jgi:hypothetical protein
MWEFLFFLAFPRLFMFFNVFAVGYSGDSRLPAAYSGDFESSL